MKSYEHLVAPDSDYYINTPSATSKKLFLYPIHTGYFHYKPHYYIKRDHFDSFLLMLITKGRCSVTVNQTTTVAKKGDLVFLDCYSAHQYGSETGWESAWIHFDGILARNYYEHIREQHGNVITLKSFQNVQYLFDKLCNIFRSGAAIREAKISAYITNILTDLIMNDPKHSTHSISESMDEIINFINEHFKEAISLDLLAEKASLSTFYFTRVFTRETGLTPHQYLLATRISYAKYMLKSTSKSVKEIAFDSGFISESGFCSSFKKWEQITPSEYRSGK